MHAARHNCVVRLDGLGSVLELEAALLHRREHEGAVPPARLWRVPAGTFAEPLLAGRMSICQW